MPDQPILNEHSHGPRGLRVMNAVSCEHPFIQSTRARRDVLAQRRPDLRVQNATADEAQIYLYDEIGFFGISANDFRQELEQVTAQRIALHINSPGGDVFDAIAIYNLLRQHPATVTTTVDSLAASAASFVALAGDRVVMARHSQVMIHDAWGFAIGDAERMREAAEFLDRQSEVIAGIYTERAGHDVAHWRALMAAETWFTAEEAVAAGLAHEIGSEEAVQNRFDLSIFRNARRPEAPAPVAAAQAGPTDEPATSALTQELLRFERQRARLAGV
jgi:ATP-dependent protease ClpP protease subunit